MKKLITILVVAIMATSVTFAQHNDPVSASATFTTTVIQPLAWDNSGDITLDDVISGQTRTFSDEVITFTLTGEAGYEVSVTTSGPESDVDGVSLIGDWDNSTDQYTLDGTNGDADFTYTCTGVDASGADDTGVKVFTVGVEAEYYDL